MTMSAAVAMWTNRCAWWLVCAPGLINAMPEHQHNSVAQPALPDAPEKAWVVQSCTQCHGIERIQHAGGTEAGWRDRVERMVRWGATISPERIKAISTYLAKALPVRPRPAASLTYFANTAVSEVMVQSVQSTVRVVAHRVDGQLQAEVAPEQLSLFRAGQRTRVFAMDSHLVMIPAKVSTVNRDRGVYKAVLETTRAPSNAAGPYLVEVVMEHGQLLAVPNDAIFEDGEQRWVYVQNSSGEYAPRVVQLGVEGDQSTQVLTGLVSGEKGGDAGRILYRCGIQDGYCRSKRMSCSIWSQRDVS